MPDAAMDYTSHDSDGQLLEPGIVEDEIDAPADPGLALDPMVQVAFLAAVGFLVMAIQQADQVSQGSAGRDDEPLFGSRVDRDVHQHRVIRLGALEHRVTDRREEVLFGAAGAIEVAADLVVGPGQQSLVRDLFGGRAELVEVGNDDGGGLVARLSSEHLEHGGAR